MRDDPIAVYVCEIEEDILDEPCFNRAIEAYLIRGWLIVSEGVISLRGIQRD